MRSVFGWSLLVWRALVLRLVLVPLYWLLGVVATVLMLSAAQYEIRFASAEAEADEFINGRNGNGNEKTED
jgi:hypothetical protein